MQYLLLGLLALAGIGLATQDALNAQLRNAVKSPILGVCISFLIGTLALGLLTTFGVYGQVGDCLEPLL